ncbi:ABC transporter ATP-binding protein [Leucobacter luti]|uniref:ABC transporter ATP-binding protein n=1 Tax=Leucobacter luti TaxID=340320 RepID=UPI003D02662D
METGSEGTADRAASVIGAGSGAGSGSGASAGSAPAIEAVGLSRSFGATQVVVDASLSVAAGEITALVGPNGSGKTTLMLMLATLLRPDSGAIRIAGHDTITETAAARAALGWMPDVLGSWDSLTVRETLLMACEMYGIRGGSAHARTDALLAATALGPLAQQRTHTLSRGQKQRLSLGRALVHEPRVLLLDEPASGLDPEARIAQREALSRLASEGVAILITSHVLDELEQLVTNAVFLREGRTVPAGAGTVAVAGAVAVAGGRSPAEAAEEAAEPTIDWRIRALDQATLERALTELGVAWTARASLAGSHCTVSLGGDARAAELLAALVARGVGVVEFSPASGLLERAFVGQRGVGLGGAGKAQTASGNSEAGS